MLKKSQSERSHEVRIPKLNTANRIYFDKFAEKINDMPNERTRIVYRGDALNFLENFNDITVEEIELEKIRDYILSTYLEIRTRKAKIESLKRFFEVVPNLKFNISDLNSIEPQVIKGKANKPLSAEDIIAFRNGLMSNRDYRARFVFEMLYIHGVKWVDIEQADWEDCINNQGKLTLISQSRTIILDPLLRDLLDKHQDLLDPKAKETYSSDLNRASKIIGLKVTENNIEDTHKKYFPVCQRCDKQYPNTSEYWALVECKEDMYHKKWLLCVPCANEIGEKQ
jgi:integrase